MLTPTVVFLRSRVINNIVIGIGTNLGDRLTNLRQALALLSTIKSLSVKKISPLYSSQALLPENAPADWSKEFLNAAVLCETDLEPPVLLLELQTIEKKLGPKSKGDWSPRKVDLDILAWGQEVYNSENLTIPHQGLLDRPFALWPLLDLLPDWQHPQKSFDIASWGERKQHKAPLQTKQILQTIQQPALVGILNTTPDSFSDGGKFNHLDNAIAQAQLMFAQGAEVIDIGAESTRPNAETITLQKEWQRLEAILLALKQLWTDNIFKPQISIDTRNAATVEKALALGVDWINDVSGEQVEAIVNLLKATDKCYVTMHNLGVPVDKNITLPSDVDVVEHVYQWGEEKIKQLMALGLNKQQIIFDPGIGFGKTPEQDVALLKNAKRFKSLGVPILIGHSRKFFMKLFTDAAFAARDPLTAQFTAELAKADIDYIRVHNIELNRQAL